MNILIINYGSSTVKYQLFSMDAGLEEFLAKGLVERAGTEIFIVSHQTKDKKIKEVIELADSRAFIKLIVDTLVHPQYGVINNHAEIGAVGHRVVHGGEFFTDSVIVTPEVKEKIRECISFAPLHNPFNLRGIELAEEVLPNVPHVAIFDTAFHTTMPPYAYIYGLPFNLYKQFGIRRYGFHGMSHKYVSLRAAQLIGKPLEQLRLITCHLGNGASIAAILNGKSVDTSMGFTPLEGLVMGTRSGSIDPAIIPYIIASQGMTTHQVLDLLNRYSGLLGISGISNDMRDIIREMERGSERAKLAIDVYTYTAMKHIASYAAVLNGVDAVVFTAGIGENSPLIREKICQNLEFIGLKLDENRNRETVGKEGLISADDSKIKVYCIPTNEELMMAREVYRVVMGDKQVGVH